MQVMINLLSNAVKFCKPGEGLVRIRLLTGPEELRVEVQDNGPGISRDHHEAIFDKFHQVGDTMTDKPQGTGLGLPISRQIIGHFGGRMWVNSDPGSGATFSFTLPRRSLDTPA
jgi:signal transduction histidine kinase